MKYEDFIKRISYILEDSKNKKGTFVSLELIPDGVKIFYDSFQDMGSYVVFGRNLKTTGVVMRNWIENKLEEAWSENEDKEVEK